MEITYSLNTEDYLIYSLYSASQSKRFRNRRLRSILIFPIICITGSLLLFLVKDIRSSVLFFTFALIWLLLHPFYFRWSVKRNYKKFIEQNYQNKIDINFKISIDENEVKIEDINSKVCTNFSEIEEIIELNNHYLINLKSGGYSCIILPKEKIDKDRLIEFVKEISRLTGINIQKRIDWCWR